MILPKRFKNEHPWSGGILFQDTTEDNLFFSVKFAEYVDEQDEYDDALEIQTWEMDEDFSLTWKTEEYPMKMYFNQETSGYDGDIRKTIEDAWEFFYNEDYKYDVLKPIRMFY